MAWPWEGGRPAEGQKDLPGTCSSVLSHWSRAAGSFPRASDSYTEENARWVVWELGGPGKGRKQRQEQNK